MSSRPNRQRAPNVPALHLAATSPSLLDATLVDLAHGSRPVYQLQTDLVQRKTALRNAARGFVAGVTWANGEQPTSVVHADDGQSMDACELLFCSNVLSHSRKFRVPGFSHLFKWKKSSHGWVCFTPDHERLALLSLAPSSVELRVYANYVRPSSSSNVSTFSPTSSVGSTSTTSSSSSTGSLSPEQTLVDTLVLTALLISSPENGPPGSPRPSKFAKLKSRASSASLRAMSSSATLSTSASSSGGCPSPLSFERLGLPPLPPLPLHIPKSPSRSTAHHDVQSPSRRQGISTSPRRNGFEIKRQALEMEEDPSRTARSSTSSCSDYYGEPMPSSAVDDVHSIATSFSTMTVGTSVPSPSTSRRARSATVRKATAADYAALHGLYKIPPIEVIPSSSQ